MILLAQQLAAMARISPELYEYGKQMRDFANRVAAKEPGRPLLLSTQLEKMRRLPVHGQELYEFGRQLRDELNARAAGAANRAPLALSSQLEAMKQIDPRLYEYGVQMVRFVNTL